MAVDPDLPAARTEGRVSPPKVRRRGTSDVVPLPSRRGAYYAINCTEENGNRVFRAWRRSGEQPVATLLGEYATLDEAKASLPVDWKPAEGPLMAWALDSSHTRLRQRAAADPPATPAACPPTSASPAPGTAASAPGA